jgi:hypothetical protein
MMSTVKTMMCVACFAFCAARGGAVPLSDYESDLQAMFGEIASVKTGDGTVSLTIPKSEGSSRIWINGIPTLYTFSSAHVMFLQWDGAFLCAALNSSEEIDEDLKSKVETMFRLHESPTSIEFRISDDRKSIIAIPAKLRKECEEAQRVDEDEDGEPDATDNPDDAQRLREGH